MKVFISVIFIVVGVLTYAFRNIPNPYIGVRFGYTYLSKEAWKKANTFAAFYCMVFGGLLAFLDFAFQLSDEIFVIVLLAGIAPMVVITYKIAKETYEKEDMRSPMYEAKLKPVERHKGVKGYLAIQILMVAAYLMIATAIWNKLPHTIAIHFNIYGKPDSFADKVSGIVLAVAGMGIIPLITGLIVKEPMLIRFPVYGSGQKALLTFLTLLQAFILAVMVAVLLFNARIIDLGAWLSWFVIGFVAFLSGWIYWMWKHYKSKPIEEDEEIN